VKLAVTAQALEDLREIEEYIGKDNPKAAVSFVQRLADRFHELVEAPGVGRKRDDLASGLRSSRVSGHLIFYTVEGEKLIVVHVLHGSRDLSKVFKQE
jgi:addiction module RelE/StbE family toxin